MRGSPPKPQKLSMPAESLYAPVLLAAIAHASWNAVVKSSTARLLMLSSIRFTGLVFGASVVWFVPLPQPQSWPYLLGAAAVHYIYYAFLLLSYRVGDLSQVYPLARGSAPLIVAGLAAIAIDEHLNATKMTAVLLVSLGILSLAFHRGTVRSGAVPFALATGTAIAGYTLLSAIGIRRSGSPLAYVGWLEIMTGLGMVLFAVGRRRAAIMPVRQKHWVSGVAAGLLSLVSYVIALFAMLILPVAPVAALRETSIIFAALIGTFKLRERFGFQRSAASCAVVLGVILLAIPSRY